MILQAEQGIHTASGMNKAHFANYVKGSFRSLSSLIWLRFSH
ncbi:hypothetical protein AC26_3127 [Escherichia coli 1-176-05_S3_C2]|nr:hypothetical protein AC26_3127 [Escherichia coli 1-176-05_S3_C2]